MPDQPVSAEDLAVTLAVREDLGLQHEPAVIGEFLDRVGAGIDARVDERLAANRSDALINGGSDDGATGLAICSLVFGVPITAISVSQGGLSALVVSWVGIAAVNIAYARRRR